MINIRTNAIHSLFQALLVLGFILASVSCSRLSGPDRPDAQVESPSSRIGQQEIICSDLIKSNELMKEELVHLSKELRLQEELVTKLQLGLLEKHAEINSLLIKNDRLLNEFVRHKPQLQRGGNRAETVRLLAEVVATIETAKSLDNEKKWTATISEAEKYLNESQVELDAGNINGASYLVSQAIDLIQSTDLEKDSENEVPAHSEVQFQAHLPMKALKNANVREHPSLDSKILFVQESDAKVTAIGYDGLWVKILISEGKHGWIHYSLLSGSF